MIKVQTQKLKKIHLIIEAKQVKLIKSIQNKKFLDNLYT
jgi:hypothetical protein